MGTPAEPTGEGTGINPDAGDNSPGPNPAWEPVLSVLPEQFHSVVTPHFQEWDKAAQQRIESVNSQLSQYEPYNKFVEHGITPEEVEQGLRLMYEINNNPRNVYDALAEAYKYNAQQPETPVANNDNGEVDPDNPLAQLPPEVLAQLGQQGDLLQTVAQIVLNDATAKQESAADADLENELSAAREKHGEFDERYVLAMMQNGYSADEAAQEFQNFQQSIAPKPFAPTVLGNNSGGGAGLPSNAIDVTKLSQKDTRSLVAQYLQQAAQQR